MGEKIKKKSRAEDKLRICRIVFFFSINRIQYSNRSSAAVVSFYAHSTCGFGYFTAAEDVNTSSISASPNCAQCVVHTTSKDNNMLMIIIQNHSKCLDTFSHQIE